MPFAKGVLADRDDLASAAQLLHEMCFDEVELNQTRLGYEPRCSDKCAACAAVWVASKAGKVMRIELRVASPADRSSRPVQAQIDGDRAARAIRHVHDRTALGEGCFLLIGRDSGVLDIFSDPPPDDSGQSAAKRIGSFHLPAWWETDHGRSRPVERGFDRQRDARTPRGLPHDDESSSKYHSYAWGITALSTFRRLVDPDALYILAATRHPRLYVLRAKAGNLRILKAHRMPGWVEWIVHQPENRREGSDPGNDTAPDRIAFISRSGDVVRLTHDELLSDARPWVTRLALLPTAVMPFDRGLLLGTTTGLFLLRDDRAIAVPATRAPVLCLDRVTLELPPHDEPDRSAGQSERQVDYIALGIEDGGLRLIDANLLQASAAGQPTVRAQYRNFAKDMGSAVLAVELLRPEQAPGDAAYMLAVMRDHSLRLFHVTTQEAQHRRFGLLWRAHIDHRDTMAGARSRSDLMKVELAAAAENAAQGEDAHAWYYALIAVVLPQLADTSRRYRKPDVRNQVINLACALASRADRRGLQQLSSKLGSLCEYKIELVLRLSRVVLSAVPLGKYPDWERFIAGHLRDLNALAERVREHDLAQLVAWNRYVRKYVLLGHTFASKQTELRELVEQNHATHKYLDALIYQTRLCKQQHDLRWSAQVEVDVTEEVTGLHTVNCDGRGTITVAITTDGRLALLDCATGGRLDVRERGHDVRRSARTAANRHPLVAFRDHGNARTLASAAVSTGAGLRVVLSCQLTPGPDAGRWTGGAGVAGNRQPGLAVIDIRPSDSSQDELIADIVNVATGDEVHAVRPLPDRADAFVLGLESHTAPLGWLRRAPGGWSLERIEDAGPADPSEIGGPMLSTERSALAPGKTPTRALAVAIDATSSGYLVVAGSDDGLVRVMCIDWKDACTPVLRPYRFDRMNDAVTSVVLGPHEPIEDAPGPDAPADPGGPSLFSCYLGTASGDVLALSIERGMAATSGDPPFGPYRAQPLWYEVLDGPILAAQVWRTPHYRSDHPHRVDDPSAEVLVIATEKGRLCLYNHAPSVAKGRVAFRVSETFNYRFRGMRLARVALAPRLRALSLIEGSADFVAAGPHGQLNLGRLAYLRDSVERETADEPVPSTDHEMFAEPAGELPTTMVARLDHLFRTSVHDVAFHTDVAHLRPRDRLKLDLCDLIRLEGGAMSSYVLYRRFAYHEPWHDPERALSIADLETSVRGYLARFDPENPEHAVLIKIVLKSLCRTYLHRDPRAYRAQLLDRPRQTTACHEETAVVCDVVAEYITNTLAYSTSAAARLRIVAIKELLRVPVLRHITRKDHGGRIQLAIDSALDACLRDDDRLVRLEALRALWVMLRNVSAMIGDSPDSDALVLALFPQGPGSIEWLLDRIVGGLLLIPSVHRRSALTGAAWHHITVLLPLFRIFSSRTLALCNELIRRGLSLEIVALCASSLHGRDAAEIRNRIQDGFLLPFLDGPNARGELLQRYKGKPTAAPVDRVRSAANHGRRTSRRWHAIDDAELTDEMARLLAQLARMWDVRDDRQLLDLNAVEVAPDSPYRAIAEVVVELVRIAGDLAKQPASRVRPLDRLASLGEIHRSPVPDAPALTAPIRRIIVGIVEAWQVLCNPRPLRAGMELDRGYVVGPPLVEGGSVFMLAEPPDLRDRYVAHTFRRWDIANAASRFLAVAQSTWALRRQAASDDARYIVEIVRVLERPPYLGYVTPRYRASLETYFDKIVGDERDRWTERAAEHLGRALRAAHTRNGSGARYHGDVRPSNILVEIVSDHDGETPVFRLDGFAPDHEPDGVARSHTIVPEILRQKHQGSELDQLRWNDIVALSLILYRILTGATLQIVVPRELSTPLEYLEQRLSARYQRRVLPQILQTLKDVFDPEKPTFPIEEFLARIAPPVVTADPGESSSVRHYLRILHISDLHIRGPRETDPARRNRVLGKRWRDNLLELRKDGAFDLIAFTGDIAFSGGADEYLALVERRRDDGSAATWLDDMLTALDCKRAQLYVVPGNHDIDRGIHPAAWQAVRDAWTGAGAEVDAAFARWITKDLEAPRGMDPALRHQLLARQGAYRAWLTRLRRRELLPDPGRSHLGYRATLRLPRLPFAVHIIGLDSAWLAGDDHDARKLRLTDDQILGLCTDSDGEHLRGLRLALVHHPLTDLADGERARRLLAEHEVDLLLSGHLHEPEARAISTPDGRLLDVATGCLYQHDRFPNALTALTLELGATGTLHAIEFRFRGWSDRAGWHDHSDLYAGTRNGRLRWPQEL